MTFSASKALHESFEVLSGRFRPIGLIAVIFSLLPVAIFMGFFSNSFSGMARSQTNPTAMITQMGSMIGQLALIYIVYLLIKTVGACAMCIAASDRLNLSLGATIAEAVRVLLPILGVYALVIVGYMVIGGALALTVGLSFMSMFSGNPLMGAGAGISVFLVVIALFVAVCFLFAKLSMVLPVVAVDKERNPINAISRSWNLTKGAAFKIFLLFVLVGIAAVISNGVLSALTGGLRLGPAAALGPVVWSQIALAAVLSTLLGMYLIALIVAIHRQLAGPSAALIGETFA